MAINEMNGMSPMPPQGMPPMAPQGMPAPPQGMGGPPQGPPPGMGGPPQGPPPQQEGIMAAPPMKNLIELWDEMKSWPDEKLMQELENPSGLAPVAIIAAAQEQRNAERERYAKAQQAQEAQQAPQTTVYEDVLAQAQGVGPPPQAPPGMGGPPQGPPPGMEQGVGGAMPPGMAPPGVPGAPMEMGPPGMPPGMPPGPPMAAANGMYPVRGYHEGGGVEHDHRETGKQREARLKVEAEVERDYRKAEDDREDALRAMVEMREMYEEEMKEAEGRGYKRRYSNGAYPVRGFDNGGLGELTEEEKEKYLRYIRENQGQIAGSEAVLEGEPRGPLPLPWGISQALNRLSPMDAITGTGPLFSPRDPRFVAAERSKEEAEKKREGVYPGSTWYEESPIGKWIHGSRSRRFPSTSEQNMLLPGDAGYGVSDLYGQRVESGAMSLIERAEAGDPVALDTLRKNTTQLEGEGFRFPYEYSPEITGVEGSGIKTEGLTYFQESLRRAEEDAETERLREFGYPTEKELEREEEEKKAIARDEAVVTPKRKSGFKIIERGPKPAGADVLEKKFLEGFAGQGIATGIDQRTGTPGSSAGRAAVDRFLEGRSDAEVSALGVPGKDSGDEIGRYNEIKQMVTELVGEENYTDLDALQDRLKEFEKPRDTWKASALLQLAAPFLKGLPFGQAAGEGVQAMAPVIDQGMESAERRAEAALGMNVDLTQARTARKARRGELAGKLALGERNLGSRLDIARLDASVREKGFANELRKAGILVEGARERTAMGEAGASQRTLQTNMTNYIMSENGFTQQQSLDMQKAVNETEGLKQLARFRGAESAVEQAQNAITTPGNLIYEEYLNRKKDEDPGADRFLMDAIEEYATRIVRSRERVRSGDLGVAETERIMP